MTKNLTHSAATPIETIKRDFALRDAKGREIGGRFQINSITYSPAPEGSTWGHYHEAGTVISASPHATRDGKAYGACQPRKEYASIEAARAAAEEYFTKAAKRAGKR